MKIIKPSVEIISPINGQDILAHIERCGRVCYKSEGKITKGSAERFVRNIIKSGHESVLEHSGFTVLFTCDRGVSHEIVRHRIASYSQESTRYCNYSRDDFGGEITVIEPCYLEPGTPLWEYWEIGCGWAEHHYFLMLRHGSTAQEARAVLPHSTKTEVVMTANLREWRHFLKLRTGTGAHPQMREVALMLLEQVREKIPVVFDDI